MDSLHLVLVEQTLAYARLLLMAAEPLKALAVVTAQAPAPVLEHPDVREFARVLRVQVEHAFSDPAYLERYGVRFKELYALGTCPEPFADRGLLELDRAKRTRAHVARAVADAGGAPVRLLSIGAGDCTLEQQLLRDHPCLSLTVSELNDTASEAVKALQVEFPGRVWSTGRFDADWVEPSPGAWSDSMKVSEAGLAAGLDYPYTDFTDREVSNPYDVVLCLEVIEHVQSPVTLLRNIRTALAPNGLVLVSTPNAAEWVERVHLDRFGEGNWYQHIRAYTPRALNADFLAAGLLPTVRHTPQMTLFVSAARADDSGTSGPAAEYTLDTWTETSLADIRRVPRGSTVYTDVRLAEAGADIRSLKGVNLQPRAQAPKTGAVPLPVAPAACSGSGSSVGF